MIHRIVSRVASAEALDFWQRLATRAWPPNETATACASPGSRRGSGTSLLVRRRRRAAGGPSIRRSRPSTRSAGSTRSAPTPCRSRALAGTARGRARRDRGRRGGVGAARRTPRRDDAYDPAPGPGEQGAGTVHHVAWGMTGGRAPEMARARRGRRVRVTRSSTATTSTRFIMSPAACCSRSPTTAPGSRSTARSRSWARGSSCPRSRRTAEEIEARLTPLPDPRAGWPEPQRVP